MKRSDFTTFLPLGKIIVSNCTHNVKRYSLICKKLPMMPHIKRNMTPFYIDEKREKQMMTYL